MNRIDFTNKINTYAARFVLEVEGFNAIISAKWIGYQT